MLTLDLLYAVLQGLPPDNLTHLHPSWVVFCKRIHRALNAGSDPISALQTALESAGPWELENIQQALSQVDPVMQLPGLSRRQKETLVALRYSKVASLTELSSVLVADRSNTQKRLNVLIKRGFVTQFFGKQGISYFAVPSPLQRSIKTAVGQIILERLEKLPATTTTTPTKTTSS